MDQPDLDKVRKEEEVELTNQLLGRYRGAQMEIQNRGASLILRGEISGIRIEVEGDHRILNVSFRWLAKGVGFPPLPKSWVVADERGYKVSLTTYEAMDFGNNRIHLSSSKMREVIMFFPRDGSRLDPSKVIGLKLD